MAPVLDDDRVQAVQRAWLSRTAWFLPGQGHSGELAAGVELDDDAIHLAICGQPVGEPDGERVLPVDAGASLGEQLPGPRRVARHQGLVVLVQHEYPWVLRLGRSRADTAGYRLVSGAGITPGGLVIRKHLPVGPLTCVQRRHLCFASFRCLGLVN